jgi:DNA-binding MarR family transcriptional regulator
MIGAESEADGSIAEDIGDQEYRALAGFRQEVRKFMAFSRRAADDAGIGPQQYQAMLAIRARGPEGALTTSEIAEELFIGASTAVELLDRLVQRGLVARSTSDEDRRRTLARLTPAGVRIMRRLAATHRDELRLQVPALTAMLSIIGMQGVAAASRRVSNEQP